MRPAENIEKFIKRVRFKASTQMHERTLKDALKAQEQSRKTKSAEIGPNIWRIIVKSRITKLTATAAIIVIAVLAINHFTSTSVVYGVTEVLELCKKAAIDFFEGCADRLCLLKTESRSKEGLMEPNQRM